MSKKKTNPTETDKEPKAKSDESNEPKKCFVMMPISDQGEYDQGHFGRVYNHLIKPACDLAGVEPVRADDEKNSNVIMIDVLRRIVECPIAICDLSHQNPNVLYELGIRHAFNMPVVLIKDNRTQRLFDVQGIRAFPYDESLRVDYVNDQVEDLGELIKSVLADPNHLNSILQLLSLQPAKVDKTTMTPELQMILDAINENRRQTNERKRGVSATTGRFRRLDGRLATKLASGEVVVSGERVVIRDDEDAIGGTIIGIGKRGVAVTWDDEPGEAYDYTFNSEKFCCLARENPGRINRVE